jgi:hypothetical protein
MFLQYFVLVLTEVYMLYIVNVVQGWDGYIQKIVQE